MSDPANIHIDYLSEGWSWRIPLAGQNLVGVVINPKHLEKYGSGIEAQYDAYIHEEPSLKYYTKAQTRMTPVVKYQNYQLVSQRMYGPGWALIGDAAGFVDPVFSTGLYLGMKSAFELDRRWKSAPTAPWQEYNQPEYGNSAGGRPSSTAGTAASSSISIARVRNTKKIARPAKSCRASAALAENIQRPAVDDSLEL